jgi:hypothetical protein
MGIVTRTLDRIKNLTRSAEDRVLIKHEFEDDDGKATKAARQFVVRMWAEESWKTERLNVAKQLIAADKLEKETKD